MYATFHLPLQHIPRQNKAAHATLKEVVKISVAIATDWISWFAKKTYFLPYKSVNRGIQIDEKAHPINIKEPSKPNCDLGEHSIPYLDTQL